MKPASAWDGDQMLVRLALLVVISAVALLYWQLVCDVTGANEPWAAADFLTKWYPIALAASAVGGFWLRLWGWSAGVIIIFAQLPVMLLNRGPAPFWSSVCSFSSDSPFPLHYFPPLPVR